MSSGGYPVAAVQPSLAPPGPAMAPHHGDCACSPPVPQITGTTGWTPWGDAGGSKHLKGERWPWPSKAFSPPRCLCRGDGAVTPQLPLEKVGAGSTVNRREGIGAPQGFALQ